MENYEWVKCPHCNQKLMKDFGDDLDIEIACNGCKAIIRIQNEAGHISYTFIRQPKKSNPNFPSHFK